MPRLETLSEVQRRTLEFFPCLEHDDTPWVALDKPLSQCKVALVTSAGLHLRDDQPFTRDTPAENPPTGLFPATAIPLTWYRATFPLVSTTPESTGI